jgi:murein hydrolase activator
MYKALGYCGWVVTLLAALSLQAAQPDKRKAEANLKSVTERIERVRRQVEKDAIEKDRINRDLAEAERSVADARGALGKVQTERGRRQQALAQLNVQREARQREREQTQGDLATQLRAAYFMGRNEPAKLLLNQRNPAEVGRNLAYYGYFGRLRANQINEISANIVAIEEIKADIEQEEAQLASLELSQKDRVSELESARRRRGRVLASHEKESRSRSVTLQRLQQQQAQLERLVRDLSRVAEATPFDPNDPFGKLRGKFNWPVSGRLVTHFGEEIAGGMRSRGVTIAADRGATVRAVHEGRVDYADWLPGHGLIIILNHGNGYLSLYSHNETLFKKAGATVQAGEAIAAAGDSGGRSESGLYFEILKGGKPIDPRSWFRSTSP